MANCIILTGGTHAPSYVSRIQRSLGPYRIASALEDAGYSTFVLDFIIHLSYEEIVEVLSKHINEETLWVGFSSTFFWNNNINDKMYYTNTEEIHKIIQFIKNNSNAKIIYGGAKAPFYQKDNLIDYYVVGYADNSIIHLTNYLKTNNSNYLIDSKKIDINGNSVVIIDSNKYPEPKLDNITTHWWNKNFNVLPEEGLPIELARGCIFKCKFCSYPLLGKKKGTYLRDSSLIKDEMIKMWETNGTTSYYFTDDTFNDDNDKIESLHKAFTSLPFKPKFSAYLRIDLINKFPHQAQLLSEMGLIGTYFGIETLNSKSAVSIGKGLHPNKVKDRLYWLKETWYNKVNMAAGFILGLPYDTKQYFSELINWCEETDNPLQNISFYPLFLFKREGESANKLKQYSSEFSLNPQIYGYEFPTNNTEWTLPIQHLTYNECSVIASEFCQRVSHRNKISEFQMITTLNVGVDINDLYNMTEYEIFNKYDMNSLNKDRLTKYKKMIGLEMLHE